MTSEPTQYLEPITTSESDLELLDRKERAPYDQNELLHALFLKYLTVEQKKELVGLAKDSPERQKSIVALLDLYTCLFPKTENKSSTGFTAMSGYNAIAVRTSAEIRQSQERSNENTWQHLQKMTGGDATYFKKIFHGLIQLSVNQGSRFTALFNKKQTEFFPHILKSDHATGATNPEHKKDNITAEQGVFTCIDYPRLSPELEGSQLLQICDHNQKATFLMSLLYLQHMSKQSCFFNGAKDQLGLNPASSQAEAKAALDNLLTPDGIRNNIPHNQALAEQLIELIDSDEFKKIFPTLQGATHDLNIQLSYKPDIDKNYSTFSTTPYTSKGYDNLLDTIPHRLFNEDNSRFVDITVAQYLSYTPAELAEIIQVSPNTLPWKDIVEIESSETSEGRWPIFATSITHESQDQLSPHTPYAASQGKNMLELDYRIDDMDQITMRYNESHAVIDGMDTKEYITLVNTVLGRNNINSDKIVIFNAPLYPVKENPRTPAERFTARGLSDFGIGRTYDNAGMNELLNKIGPILDPADKNNGTNISTKIYKFVQSELAKPQSILQILNSLIYEYPKTLARFSVPDSSITDPRLILKVPELADIDPKDELQVLCLKLRHAYEYESARIKGVTELPTHYRGLEKDEIAKEIRNNLCPRPSFIHMLDIMIALKRGGILNCTGMLSKHGRFGLSAVKPIGASIYPKIVTKEQLSTTEYQEIMDTIILNLNEQSRTRIGHGSPAFLGTLTGLTKKLASVAAEPLNKLLVKMTGKTIAQSSTLGKSLLQWFFTANSTFNDTNGLAVGDIIRADGTTGALTYRTNLAKANVRRAFGISDNDTDKEKIITMVDHEFEADIRDTFALAELLARGPAAN